MTPYALNTAALFVPRDSPLSQVELLAPGLRPHGRSQHGKFSRDQQPGKDVHNCQHGLGERQNEVAAGSTAPANSAVVDSGATQQSDVGLHWWSLRSQKELEFHLSDRQRFRALIIRKEHSHSELSVSQDLFEGITSYCGLSTQFQDVLAYFGSRDLEVELAAPRLRFTTLSRHPSAKSRTGFECMYGLRFVELNNRGDPRRLYSLRQMAVCNKEEADVSLATWVFVSPPPHVMLSVSEYLEKQNIAASNKSFDVHLLLFKFAISSWRPYLVHLTQEVQEHANMVLVAAPTGNGPISLNECGDLQRLKQLGDEMLDAEVVLSATHDALRRLTEGYTQHITRQDADGNLAVNENEDNVYHQLMEHSRQLDWLLQQTHRLRQKLLGTSQLVTSFLALGSGRSLEDLGKEARTENTQIRELTKKSARDAAAVKVLTVMMLIYLPTTVVSNFFSTSFVDNNSLTGPSRKLIVLHNWWILVVIAVPLTIVTMYIWWVFTNAQGDGTHPGWWQRIARLKLPLSLGRSHLTDEESNIGPVSMTSDDCVIDVASKKI